MALIVRVCAGAAITVVTAAGILLLGRASDDMNAAMGLTAAWLSVVLFIGVVLARRNRPLLIPLAIGYAAVAAATLVLIVLPTLVDKTVDEQVATAAPAASDDVNGTQARNTELSRGAFTAIARAGRGTATAIRLGAGSRVLTLTNFETDSGPDLRLYLSAGDPAGGSDLGAIEDLGALKGNTGNQQYAIPDGVDLERLRHVVMWCRAFSVGFTSAALRCA